MTDQPTKASEPTEKAQIVITSDGPTTLVMRYRTEKKANAQYERLQKQWIKWRNCEQDSSLVLVIPGDMFDSAIDITKITFISLVLHSVRDKFIPR